MNEDQPANEPTNSPDANGSADPVNSSPGAVDSGAATGETSAEKTIEMLEQFPPEIATLLIMAGIAGVLLPGPVGAPLLIAGGVILWPKTFRPVEHWFSRKFPAMHREGVIQLKEFIRDLNQRFPSKG